MARNVYLDPFGTYTSAFDKGLARQMDVESNRRQARASDFDYNFMQPIRYNDARIANQYNTAALPYRVRDLGYGERATRAGLFGQEYGIGQNLARDFGIVEPALRAFSSYDPRYGYELNPETGAVDFISDRDPTTGLGNYMGGGTVQGILSRYMLPEAIAEAQRQQQALQQNFTNQVQIQQLENNRRYQDAILWQQILGGSGSNGGLPVDISGLGGGY